MKTFKQFQEEMNKKVSPVKELGGGGGGLIQSWQQHQVNLLKKE